MSHNCSETVVRENEHEMVPWEDGDFQAKQGTHPPNSSSFKRLRRWLIPADLGAQLKPTYEKVAAFVGRSGRKSAFRYYAALSGSRMSSGKFSGWKGGLLLASITTSVVLAANLIFTIAAVATSRDGIYIGTLYTGTCAATHRTNTYFHLLINILSTFMLAASNYTMQFLSAPTREQVDRSHKTGRWLTIGIMSPRNLQTGKKATLFTLLALTSFPIHFLWNSAIFVTDKDRADPYYVFIATEDLLNQTMIDCATGVYSYQLDPPIFIAPESPFVVLHELEYPPEVFGPLSSLPPACPVAESILAQYHDQELTMMNKSACIENYQQVSESELPLWQTDVLAVTTTTWNRTILEVFRPPANNWICGMDEPCTPETPRLNGTWVLGWEAVPIDYCLITPPRLPNCQVNFSTIVMIAVIICNVVKVCCIFIILYTEHEHPFAALGDALASFLESPDLTTCGECLLDRKKVLENKRQGRAYQRWEGLSRRTRLYEAPSRTRWWLTISLTVACLVALCWAVSITGADQTLGNVDSANDPFNDDVLGGGVQNIPLFAWSSSFSGAGNLTLPDFSSPSIYMKMISVINAPQLLLSAVYFLYNAMFTSIACAIEWSRFSHTRKSLRTTERRGDQRPTYWLSLPWKWAIPIGAFSTMLHFFASEALFVLRVEGLDHEGNLVPLDSKLDVGCSYLGFVALTTLTCVILCLTIGIGMIKLPRGSLLVGNNSLAISAACHPPEGDGHAALLPVMWGAVSHESENKAGHCCFTSEEVEQPRRSGWYE